MRVKCLRDVYHSDMLYFSKDKVYTVNKEYYYGVSVYVKYNDPQSSFMFYYDNSKYMGLVYDDYFVSIEEYRNNQLKELGI